MRIRHGNTMPQRLFESQFGNCSVAVVGHNVAVVAPRFCRVDVDARVEQGGLVLPDLISGQSATTQGSQQQDYTQPQELQGASVRFASENSILCVQYNLTNTKYGNLQQCKKLESYGKKIKHLRVNNFRSEMVSDKASYVEILFLKNCNLPKLV